jgi:hypothetical protein
MDLRINFNFSLLITIKKQKFFLSHAEIYDDQKRQENKAKKKKFINYREY